MRGPGGLIIREWLLPKKKWWQRLPWSMLFGGIIGGIGAYFILR